MYRITSADSGYAVYAQNTGTVYHDHFAVTRPRPGRRLPAPGDRVDMARAKRLAWARARELAARLEREGHPWTMLRVERFETGHTTVVYTARPGSEEWARLLA